MPGRSAFARGSASTVAPSRGKIKVYVDGTDVVWESRWGSPRVDVDGFVTVR